MTKLILSLDFDGVIHSYDRGWNGGELYGGLTIGFVTWAEEAVKHFQIAIHTSRFPKQKSDVIEWLFERLVEYYESARDLTGDQATEAASALLNQFEFYDNKPPAFLTIDDRALRFTGNWGDFPVSKLSSFKPWNYSK